MSGGTFKRSSGAKPGLRLWLLLCSLYRDSLCVERLCNRNPERERRADVVERIEYRKIPLYRDSYLDTTSAGFPSREFQRARGFAWP